MNQKLKTSPPPSSENFCISFPSSNILLVTLDRPQKLNSLLRRAHLELSRLWAWYDNEPSLRCAVITGKGNAFCAGADLKEWHEENQAGVPSHAVEDGSWLNDGFGGMSNRRGKKPIIAAVNGHCFGGGFEMMVNSDCVITSDDAKFGLPEVNLGVAAVAGALPRLTRIIGRQRAAEMSLLGRTYTAEQISEWGIFNRVVPKEEVVPEALRWAAEIADMSPDSVILTRAGLLGGWDGEDPVSSTHRITEGLFKAVDGGKNFKEGVSSFVEKRKAIWTDSKL